MADRTCGVDGCTKPHYAFDVCRKHYDARRQRLAAQRPVQERLDEAATGRFWRHVRRTEGCWSWTGSKTPGGYGQLNVQGRPEYAHRLSYLVAHGELPDGLELDHLCRNRACVRPDHLEAVSHRMNVLRGESLSADHARKTHCKHGHPFSEENTYLRPEGWRACKECRRRQGRGHYAANRAGRNMVPR